MKSKCFNELEVFGVIHVITLANVSYKMYRNKIKEIHADTVGFFEKEKLFNSAALRKLNDLGLIITPDKNYGVDISQFGYRRISIRKK